MKRKEFITINIDFDHTCIVQDDKGDFIEIGAIPVLKRLAEEGHRLILFTCRSNRPYIGKNGLTHYNELNEAIDWFRKNGIELYGVQTNPKQKIWTESPKSHADLMIDDTALGAPLIYNPEITDKPFIDWEEVEKYLVRNRMI